MIVVMEPKATEKQIQKVSDYLQKHGFKINLNRGEVLTVIAAIGDKRMISTATINSFDGVHEVKLIQEPYKLSGRRSHPEDTIIEFQNGVKIGGLEKPVLMVGPCSVEKEFEGLIGSGCSCKKKWAANFKRRRF